MSDACARNRFGSIRGVKASASLKLPPLAKDLLLVPGYPRCKSLGLIEARLHDGTAENNFGIRGVKASASLKQHPIPPNLSQGISVSEV